MEPVTRHPVFSIEPGNYSSHDFHRLSRDWVESNCYVDLYVEILNALQVEVASCFAFTLGADFEGDQWTFFKPPLLDMKELFGMDVQELTLWRPLQDQIAEQVARGCLVTAEVDAYYLPDTVATDYKTAHVKTTIAVPQIDIERKRLLYFHNAGFFELTGEDFDGVFGIGHDRPANYLPPYCELIKLGNLTQLPEAKLAEIAQSQAERHFASRPKTNPFLAYQKRLEQDLPWLLTQPQSVYHNYVFVTLRQCGANFEFAAFFVEWLARQGTSGLEGAAAEFRSISQTAKMLILKIARMVRSKKASDITPALTDMGDSWERAMDILAPRLGAKSELSG